MARCTAELRGCAGAIPPYPVTLAANAPKPPPAMAISGIPLEMLRGGCIHTGPQSPVLQSERKGDSWQSNQQRIYLRCEYIFSHSSIVPGAPALAVQAYYHSVISAATQQPRSRTNAAVSGYHQYMASPETRMSVTAHRVFRETTKQCLLGDFCWTTATEVSALARCFAATIASAAGPANRPPNAAFLTDGQLEPETQRAQQIVKTISF